jgi:hypothetical protein
MSSRKFQCIGSTHQRSTCKANRHDVALNAQQVPLISYLYLIVVKFFLLFSVLIAFVCAFADGRSHDVARSFYASPYVILLLLDPLLLFFLYLLF